MLKQHTRVKYFANRFRDRGRLPRDLAAELIRTLEIDPEDRRFVEGICARWEGVRDVLASAAGPRAPLGDLLIKAGRLTSAQLDSALALQRDAGLRLGEILVRNGWLTERELRALLVFQKRLGKSGPSKAGPLQLGNLLVATGGITQEQLRHALEHQHQPNQRLGEVLISAGYATEREVAQALRLQRTLLGVALGVLLALSLHSAAAGAATSGDTRRGRPVPVG